MFPCPALRLAVPPLRKIGLILLVFVAVPVGVVALAELAALGENERVLREIYDRHVETVLATINQYVWNVADGWTGDLERRLATSDDVEATLAAFVADYPSIEAAFVADTAVTDMQVASALGATGATAADLGLRPSHARRLLTDRAEGYRRLLPIPLREDQPNATVALAFVTDDEQPRIAGFVLSAWTSIETELMPKLRAAAQDQFLIGIAVDGDVRYTIAPSAFGLPADGSFDATAEATRLLSADDVTERALWVFPNYTLRIRPTGATISSIVTDRTQRSLLLVGLLALALAVGAAFLFRTIRRQVELGEAKAVFVQNVSHELRTPLALIRMYAETLELGRVPEERRRDYVRTIAQEAGRLTRLVNNILNFSRIESGRKEVAAAPFDLNALAADALALYRFHLDSEGFAVESALAEPPPVALGDREATSEALLNLIDNAVKYSEAERHLTVATGTDGEAVWVEVRDRGLGIALREQKRIFDEFYRVPTGAVHNAKGTGLGLALVKHLAEAQGGRITVRSTLGHGSTFRLTLPAAPVPHAPFALATD